jgi:hypothetical protein
MKKNPLFFKMKKLYIKKYLNINYQHLFIDLLVYGYLPK